MRRRYRRRLARCQKNFSEGSVHNLRIETRRMLAMLDLLHALRAGEALKKMRRMFKQRLDTFDELRDTHVQLLMLKPWCRRFHGLREFYPWLRRHEKRLVGGLRHEIKAMKQLYAEGRLKKLEKQIGKSKNPMVAATGNALAAAALNKAFIQVVKLRRCVRRSDTETIHRMRVAFKRFRYMSELLRPFFPRLTTARLGKMRKYQALMGDIQDIEIVLEGSKRAVEKKRLLASDAGDLHCELMHERNVLIEMFMATVDRVFEFQPVNSTRQTGHTRLIRI